jgi:hypothetical protein
MKEPIIKHIESEMAAASLVRVQTRVLNLHGILAGAVTADKALDCRKKGLPNA